MHSWILASTLALATPAVAVLHLSDARIHFAFSAFPHQATLEEIRAFVLRSAEPVAAYYGRFPIKQLRLEVLRNDRKQGLFGKEFHGNRVQFFIGEKATAAQMHESGILTHEMFHLGFPDLPREYAWIEEGLATYLAHLARARAGQTTESEFWNEINNGFQDSLPKPGDGGLASADNYRRIYWGGALFWLEIDLEIRDQTHGTKSLDTVTRAILNEGGTNAHRWKLSRLQHAVDRHAGFAVFQKWFEFFGEKPGKANLPALWAKLGLTMKDGRLEATAPNKLRASLLTNEPPLAKLDSPH